MEVLDQENPSLEEEKLYQQFLLQAAQNGGLGGQLGEQKAPISKTVIPKPGCCLKTKINNSSEKIFINICMAENLPTPKEISDEDLLKLLESDDPTGFRVPMSLGEAHAEIDKAGRGCTAYDVIVNPDYYTRMINSQVMMGFFISIVLEGLEHKYNMSLDRHWKLLKNRKFVGTLPEQNVRTQSKPFIMEMDGATPDESSTKSLISEISPTEQNESPKVRAPEPSYTIIKEPANGHPEFLVAEIHLPKIKTAASLTLDLGEDRILLATRSNIYGLDIFLPFNLVQDECGAQFDRKSKVLTLTMPVQPE